MKSIFFTSIFLFIAHGILASEKKVEQGQLPSSVVAHDTELGFQLSDVAIARLGIQFRNLEGKGPWNIPKTSLVKIKRSMGVYRQSNSFITLVFVEVLGTNGENARIHSEDLRAGDHVAVVGSGFLRVVELDLSGGGGDSCGG
jgi:hypothetical protein